VDLWALLEALAVPARENNHGVIVEKIESLSQQKKIRRYLTNWQNEVDSTAQYVALGAMESDTKIARIYRRLGSVEEKHVRFWEDQLLKVGAPVPLRKPSWRSQVLIWLAKKLGPHVILPTISQQESAGGDVYRDQSETKDTGMSSEEREHSRVLKEIGRVSPRGASGTFLAKIEGRHKAVGGNALRAAVLGANDGLCSNLSLVMGVAGVAANSHNLLLTGLAGLFAGAGSMALGEWISVTSSRELAQREIQIEADELESDPAGEEEELKLIYESKGLSQAEASDLAHKMISDKDRALDTLTREELGIDPDDLGGSATEAAAFSFVLFAFGAIIPVSPFFFFTGTQALVVSVIFSALALYGFGAFITLFTGRSALISGSRQMALGLLAALLTFGLGRIIGVSLN
jgi:VIT1/CCC1 family predicted Fe2+/Mn2+ transporter